MIAILLCVAATFAKSEALDLTIKPGTLASRYGYQFRFEKAGPALPTQEGLWGIHAQGTLRLLVSLNGQDVVVPYSAYGDLSFPHRGSFSKKGNEVSLRMEGGDAGESYWCTISFRNDLCVFREVHHGEFPDNFYEKTYYVSKKVPD